MAVWNRAAKYAKDYKSGIDALGAARKASGTPNNFTRDMQAYRKPMSRNQKIGVGVGAGVAGGLFWHANASPYRGNFNQSSARRGTPSPSSSGGSTWA